MKLAPDPRFLEESERFDLRSHCEDCALFDEARESCAHGFPTAEHRRPARRGDGRLVVFCKDFEVA